MKRVLILLTMIAMMSLTSCKKEEAAKTDAPAKTEEAAKTEAPEKTEAPAEKTEEAKTEKSE